MSNNRFLHSIGTSHTCLQLAYKWGFNAEEVCLAGLLHDSAKGKHLKEFEKTADIKNYEKQLNFSISDEDKDTPQIWHAAGSSHIAETIFGIPNKDILKAIKTHPTADVNFSQTAKVLFVADYIEPHRKFEGVESYRKLAFENFEAAFKKILQEKINHVIQKGKVLHPRSKRALEYYT